MSNVSYNSNIISFFKENHNENTGWTYRGITNFTTTINHNQKPLNVEIELEVEIVEHANEWKTNTRVKNFGVPDEIKKENNKTFFMEILPICSKLINICDSQFNIEVSNGEFPSEFEIDLSKGVIVIPNEKNMMLLTSKQKLKIFDTTFLVSLESFLSEWNNHISNKSFQETDFRNLLLKNKSIFPPIFGIDDINNVYFSEFYKEKTLSEGLPNRPDIENKDICIELKKPDTPIFGSHSTKNIKGLSSNLISAANQVSLYLFKKDREKIIENFSFTKGILIIGSNEQFLKDKSTELDKEKLLSWNLFRQNYKIDIITFDDISKRVENLIKSIKKPICDI